MTGPGTAHPVRRWPLTLIALPASVAIWSGWVGLAGLCGFGPIHPLPGIAGGFTLNTAITLPVGVECYGAYALRVWLTAGVPQRAQEFARRSAIGALSLGMCGQVAYHLLRAAHATRAPWPVVVLVSCIPVVTLGMAAALTHMLSAIPEPEARRQTPAETTTGQSLVHERLQPGGRSPHEPAARPGTLTAARQPVGAPGLPSRPRQRPGRKPRAGRLVTAEDVARHYAAQVATGQLPSQKAIRRQYKVGSKRAREWHSHLRSLAGAGPG